MAGITKTYTNPNNNVTAEYHEILVVNKIAGFITIGSWKTQEDKDTGMSTAFPPIKVPITDSFYTDQRIVDGISAILDYVMTSDENFNGGQKV